MARPNRSPSPTGSHVSKRSARRSRSPEVGAPSSIPLPHLGRYATYHPDQDFGPVVSPLHERRPLHGGVTLRARDRQPNLPSQEPTDATQTSRSFRSRESYRFAPNNDAIATDEALREQRRRRDREYDRPAEHHRRGDDARYDRRRERSPDRYDRSARYERDERLYRERERDVGRQRRYREHSRDRARSRREDSRDRYRERRDVSRERHAAHSRRNDGPISARVGSKHDPLPEQLSVTRSIQSPASPATPSRTKTQEEKLAERLEKLKEARVVWKNQKEQERLDKIARADPDAQQTPANSTLGNTVKFDPKAFGKRSSAINKASSNALGGDIAVPASAKSAATQDGLNAAHDPSGSKNIPTQPASKAPKNSSEDNNLKGGRKVTGLALGSRSQNDHDKPPNKQGLDLEEQTQTRRKLEKLPDMPLPHKNDDDTALADAADEDDGQAEQLIDDGDNEEEAARVAREAREKRLNNVNEAAEQAHEDEPIVQATEVSNEDEIDPLDAFMAGLDKSSAQTGPGVGALKRKATQPAELLEEDDKFATMDAANVDDLYDVTTKTKKRREVAIVDHSKMKYEPFRKDFYKEPAEIAGMSEEEVANVRLGLDGIKVRGLNPPKPVTKWSQFGLNEQSLDVVRKLGYDQPTSIQAQAIPAIMSGRDVIGIAKTGSGKTIAFLMPMFRHIADQPKLKAQDGPIGVVLAPTRELATQIHKDCRPWLKALGLRAVCCYGGAPIKDQIGELKRGAEIVIATAGRLIDLLAANSGRVCNFNRTTYVVLDEADRMFDMGFEPQVMRIMGNIRPDRQTVMFSATFPRQMEALARKVLTRPVEIQVGGRSTVAPEITQIVEVRNDETKFKRLLQLLGEVHQDDDARSLIFVDRHESAEDLMSALMKKGYPANSLHGGKDQDDRDDVIGNFKAGVFPVLVATSVAARGLDVKQLKLVVNFDCPNHLEDYVHRVGRTGRAGQTGTAVTFVTDVQERYAKDIAKALTQSGQPVPEDLQKMVNSFSDKIKAGKEKAGSSGFGGRGIERYDEQRDAQLNRERKTYKTGDEPESDKEDEDPDKIPEIKPQAKSDKKVANTIEIDETITVHKREVTEDSQDAMRSVNDRVAAINNRLRSSGSIRGNAPIDNKGPDAGAYHATLHINDYPQKARWAVTNRTNVAKILEATGTSITTKGNYYPEGTEPGPNEQPKLFILVEGDTELVVTQAMREMLRLLKDGVADALATEARAPVKSGRYSVL